MRTLIPLLSSFLLVFALACDGSSSPTAPALSKLTLVDTEIVVDGNQIGNAWQHPGPGHDGLSTRFEARLMADGVPAAGHHLFVEVTPPGGMGGGHMWNQHRFELWDDGTRGDPVAGDGIYCLEDFGGQHGFHHAGARHGEYHYEFWGAHHDDFSQSNHVTRTIQVTD